MKAEDNIINSISEKYHTYRNYHQLLWELTTDRQGWDLICGVCSEKNLGHFSKINQEKYRHSDRLQLYKELIKTMRQHTDQEPHYSRVAMRELSK